MMGTLATALPNEINRVRELQDEYKSMRGMPNVMVEPAITMMENSIRDAIAATTGGDVVNMLRCYEDLKGFSQ
jgi:hypothetical protein